MSIVTGDVWTFEIEAANTVFIPSRQIDFSQSYDPSKSWQFVDGEYKWTDLSDVVGGGRYKNSIVTFTIDIDGNGSIFYS